MTRAAYAILIAIFFIPLCGAPLARAQYYVYPYAPYGYAGGDGNIRYGNATWYNVWGNGPVSGQTLPASRMTATTVVLNGVVSGEDPLAKYHFEYGPSPSLGISTESYQTPANTQTNVAYQLTGLYPNTVYFYRIVAQNNFGNGQSGQVLSFRTEEGAPQRAPLPAAYPSGGAPSGGGAVSAPSGGSGGASAYGAPSAAEVMAANGQKPAITDAYTPTTSYGLGARLSALFGARPYPCLTLSGELSNKSVSPGQATSYAVTGRNNCLQDFTDAMLQVSFPKEVQFTSSTAAYSSAEGGAYRFNLGTFPRKSTLAITLTGIADKNIQGSVPVHFAALLNFADNGAPQVIGTITDAEISPSFLAGVANVLSSFGNLRALSGQALLNLALLVALGTLISFMWRGKRKKPAIGAR